MCKTSAFLSLCHQVATNRGRQWPKKAWQAIPKLKTTLHNPENTKHHYETYNSNVNFVFGCQSCRSKFKREIFSFQELLHFWSKEILFSRLNDPFVYPTVESLSSFGPFLFTIRWRIRHKIDFPMLSWWLWWFWWYEIDFCENINIVEQIVCVMNEWLSYFFQPFFCAVTTSTCDTCFSRANALYGNKNFNDNTLTNYIWLILATGAANDPIKKDPGCCRFLVKSLKCKRVLITERRMLPFCVIKQICAPILHFLHIQRT